MIQRIQSVYLFLALLVLGWAFTQLPVIHSIGPDLAASPTNEKLTMAEEIAIGVCALLTFAGIFLYANRKRQMWVVKVAMALTFIGFVLMVVDYFVTRQQIGEAGVDFNLFPLPLALVALILQWLGHRGIAKDEKLVREADRLR